jgi:DNA-directed RNA polymerase specialized sigma24 family protein
VNRPQHKKRWKNFAAFIGAIYSFVRRQGTAPEEAEDVTQAVFADLLAHKSLTAVRKEKGGFRSYLLGALKYFLADERRRAMAIKRGKRQR